ncbi:MAG TPA: primosomal protein N' [Solirubrobacteraceae bacterium]|nr:primosomal protein N' [Solirubrobacteraceae bacterium]
MIARALPLTRTRAVRGLFDYRLSDAQVGSVEVGSILRVRFGPRRALAVVAELAESSELAPDRLVEPDAVLAPPLPADLVELAGWMAREYCSTPARALQPMLPPGIATGMRSKRALVATLTAAGVAALNDNTHLTDGQRTAMEALSRHGPTVAARLGTPVLRRLEGRGLVSLSHAVQRRVPVAAPIGSSRTVPELTSEQTAALAPVLEALAAGRTGSFLLHGVTGSGKTEVYLRAVQETLRRGRTAIVLVPEIALTPQTLSRFQERFGDVVAVIHSGLGQGERYDEWRRLAGGEALVCVGPRSAVFAPLREIGLIIVDEEHESSYKHEGDPRYDARAVAEHRAAAHGAVLLHGSATPRPESASSLERLRLHRRVDGRPLPPVRILDMRGQHHPLHPVTRAALSDLKRDGGKAIVLLNRRGWSNFLSCRSCGRVWMCPNCEVALVLHRQGAFVACHHCGHRERVPERCGACGSVSVARHGAGTERIESELAQALGDRSFPVLRLDADAPGAGRGGVLRRFQEASSAVLVGTQMVAKGHDFPDVALGIVLDADQTLRFPDFRAEERTFALITQLAGRAGRGNAGRVLVQTLAPEARAIQLAARHDSDGFLAGELERRRLLGYPPFRTLVRIVCSAVDAADATAAAMALRAGLDPPQTAVLGPAPLFVLRGRARVQLVLKAGDRQGAIDAVGAAVDAFVGTRAARDVNVSVDVDPQ